MPILRFSRHLLVGGDGQFVTAVVFWMTAMPGDSRVFDPMFGCQFIQLPPQVFVLNRYQFVFFFALPVLLLPFGHPFRQAFANINAVREQFDVARSLEQRQPFDDRPQFHSIISRIALVARMFRFLARRQVAQNQTPTPRSRVAATSSIGKQMDVDLGAHVGTAHWGQLIFESGNI